MWKSGWEIQFQVWSDLLYLFDSGRENFLFAVVERLLLNTVRADFSAEPLCHNDAERRCDHEWLKANVE